MFKKCPFKDFGNDARLFCCCCVMHINQMIHMFPNWCILNIYSWTTGTFRTVPDTALTWSDTFVFTYGSSFLGGNASPCSLSPLIIFYSSFKAFLLITMKTVCLGPFYTLGLWGSWGWGVLKYAFRERLLVSPFPPSFIFPGHGTKPCWEKYLYFHCTVSLSHKLIIQEMLTLCAVLNVFPKWLLPSLDHV